METAITTGADIDASAYTLFNSPTKPSVVANYASLLTNGTGVSRTLIIISKASLARRVY